MSNWGKIAVGTRIGEGRCDPLFFRSWTRLIAGGLRAGDTVLDPAMEMPHHVSANLLVKYFLKTDADTLCMIDSDMVFEPDTLTKLRESGAEYDVLSALCTTRRAPYVPVVLRCQYEKDDVSYLAIDPKDIDGSLVDVDAASIAFSMIRRGVFDKLSKLAPWWFDWGSRGLGEDTRFSQRAKGAGLKLGVNTGVSIQHRGMIGFEWDVADRKIVLRESTQIGEIFNTKGE